MTTRAPVLVHGATGFTGALVCEALRRRGVPFAIGGRDPAKLEAMRAALGGDVEACTIDLGTPDTIRAAIAERAIVCACAGPFVKIGEPMLASCARAGVHYVDTTGEQPFVALAVARYRATAEASGACIVPALAFEIAPADWGCDLAAKRVGGAPDAIDVAYANAPEGGYAAATTRGTKRSIVAMAGDPEPRQWIDGRLARERAAAYVARFPMPDGRALTAASFPSPEAIVVPSHTGARTVRTFMGMGALAARAMQATRAFAPVLARAAAPIAERAIGRAPAGPSPEDRARSVFTIVIEARRADARARVWVTGRDPYGLTAEIQAWAAERAVARAIRARGVVAPSVAFPAEEALAALAFTGLRAVDAPPDETRDARDVTASP